MALVVRLPDGQTLRFTSSFHIGRERGCDVEVVDTHVSRRHAEVSFAGGRWVIRDLQSSNGLFVNGRRVDTAPIGHGVQVTLGEDGPTLRIEPEEVGQVSSGDRGASEDDTLDSYAQRYFTSEDDEDESVGGRTLMIRKAFQKVQQQQRRRHRVIIAAVAVIAVAAGAYALYAHRALGQQRLQAQEIFYRMKAQDVLFAELEQKLSESGSTPGQQQIAAYMAERQRMQQDYDRYVADLFDRTLNQKERLVLRVTRLFGECDAAAPPEYIGEVMRYVAKWRSTGRFERALKRAQDSGYITKIAAAFKEQNLPPQYFYLAMQESSFDPYAIGSPTKWGIAKGMWQFIPDTGSRYGLRIGPLAAQPSVEQVDDRFNWEKATPAAARYIKDIYSTDAQASGLLVMASYNWGEWRVIDYLRRMPANPRQRNFWKFLAQYKEHVPLQTYEYVFSIVSAAVIGENPRLFGFPFDNPLAFAAQR
ncbi:MAG: FHA domain-containing protein [Vicinamibacterales bacterium]